MRRFFDYAALVGEALRSEGHELVLADYKRRLRSRLMQARRLVSFAR